MTDSKTPRQTRPEKKKAASSVGISKAQKLPKLVCKAEIISEPRSEQKLLAASLYTEADRKLLSSTAAATLHISVDGTMFDVNVRFVRAFRATGKE